MARPGQAKVPPGLERAFLAMVLQAAKTHVRAYMGAVGVSETLRQSLTTEMETNFLFASAKGRLVIPYYWAEFVHNGRGDAYPKGTYMIYFPNKRDDPRTEGATAYPKQLGSRRKLTREELDYFDEINRERRRLKQPPIMVMKKRVGPGEQAQPGKQFYVRALRVFPKVQAVENRLLAIVRKIAPNGSRKIVLRV
jgi:hypothetical protein